VLRTPVVATIKATVNNGHLSAARFILSIVEYTSRLSTGTRRR
jgi:hypothetical protein